MANAPPAALIGHFGHGRGRHDDDGQVDGVGHVKDALVADVTQDFAGRGVDRVNGSPVAIVVQVADDAMA